jgi:predicted TIM-barrel fold metal-dependent hydrolase
MLITDVQIYIWEIDRPDRPWMKGLQRPPHRPDGFSAEEILAEMDAVGVNRAVIVTPTWVGDWLDDGSLDRSWKACEEFGIPVMALAPGMQC